MTNDTDQDDVKMQLAHVLFTDIVAYSKLPTDEQSRILRMLQEIVRGTAEVSRARAQDKLITLATGDGIALVFFNDPMAPVQCALEISRALKGHPEIKVRMGIHSGPVDKIVDVNDSVNVAGAGINMAQRVMDSGDAGHILVSRRVAEDLANYSTWQPFLHDLKEVEVKHGVRMHMFNLYTGEAGNAQIPEKIRSRQKRSMMVPAIGISLFVILISCGVLFYLRSLTPPDKQKQPETEFTSLLQKKSDAWIDSIFAAQAPSGGLKGSPAGTEQSVQAWSTAQGLMAVLSTRKPLDSYVPRIKSGFSYIEKVRRTAPAEGWNYYDNSNPYTVTEIGGWVTMAYIKSLDNPTAIWSDTERDAVLKRISRDLEELKRRQDASGGFRPIRDQGPEFVRTYSTIIALWAMVEGKRSPAVSGRISSVYNDSIRNATNWLLSTYKQGQGWVPNPSHGGQREQFDGLTAQALSVLSREESLAEFAYLKNDPTYAAARRDFLNNKKITSLAIEDNSHIADVDLRFVPSEFMAEGSTYLWFPWTLLELTRLSFDQGLSPQERATADKMRLDILNTSSASLDNYVESANLTYQYAENLFCVTEYVKAMEDRK